MGQIVIDSIILDQLNARADTLIENNTNLRVEMESVVRKFRDVVAERDALRQLLDSQQNVTRAASNVGNENLKLKEQVNRLNILTKRQADEIIQLRAAVRTKDDVPEEPVNKISLFDNLKPGDTILYSGNDLTQYGSKNKIDHNIEMTVDYIDTITRAVYVKSNKWNGTIHKSSIDNLSHRIAEAGKVAPKNRKFPVLQVSRIVETESYLWHYDESWIDKFYINYCNGKSRSYPTKKSYTLKDELQLSQDDLLKWLQEVTAEDNELKESIRKAMFVEPSVPPSEEPIPPDTSQPERPS